MTKPTPIVKDEKKKNEKRRDTILEGSATLPSSRAAISVATQVGAEFSKKVMNEEKKVLDQKHAAIDHQNHDHKLGKAEKGVDAKALRPGKR